MSLTAELTDRKLPPSFTTKFTPDDFRFFRMVVHPTKRMESVDATRRMLAYIMDHEVVTCKQIQEDLHLSEAPVLKRLKIFKDFKLVKRERNKYYLATPRLMELINSYIDIL